jgi:hypothetical protein
MAEETTPEMSRRPIYNILTTTKQCPVQIQHNIQLVPCIVFGTRISEPYIEVLPLFYRLFIPHHRSPSTVVTTKVNRKSCTDQAAPLNALIKLWGENVRK